MSTVSTRLYRVATLDQLADDPARTVNGRPMVERVPYLDAATLEQPGLAFGTTDFAGLDLQQTPSLGAGPLRVARPAIPAYVLRDANIHTMFGIVTLGDCVVQETLYHAPLFRIPGAERDGDGMLRLPLRPLSAKLPSAYHLLAGNLDNYFHWLLDALTRFDPVLMERLGPGLEADGGCVVLLPELDQFWKWETASLLLPRSVPRVALVEDSMVFAQRLVFLPNMTGGGFLPHPRLNDVFDAMRAAVGGTADPWRRIYVARSDSRNRLLVNEAEIAARAAAAGFTPVVLSGMPVAEQARLFAEASHIVAPHGAGLTNVMFCRPGTAFCELHMDRYVQWAFRRLAMLRGLRYGCVIGTALPPFQDWVHAMSWHLDPRAVDAVLHDPRFIGA